MSSSNGSQETKDIQHPSSPMKQPRLSIRTVSVVLLLLSIFVKWRFYESSTSPTIRSNVIVAVEKDGTHDDPNDDESCSTRKGNIVQNAIPTLFGLHYEDHHSKCRSSNAKKRQQVTDDDDDDNDDFDESQKAFEEEVFEIYNKAWTPKDIEISNSQKSLLEEFGKRCSAYKDRMESISWGGGHNHHHHHLHHHDNQLKWWYPTTSALSKNNNKNKNAISNIEGGYLLYSYMNIMKWPQDLVVHFPFRLCNKDTCPAERSILHTIEYREKFKPWCMTPSAIAENKNGWVYYYGHASQHIHNDYYGHSMVYVRPGQHTVVNPLSYFRAMLHTIEMAIVHNLQVTDYQVGKFNVVVDAKDYSFSKLPSLTDIKQGVTMLQDHLPNRLGMILLMNLSRGAEFFLNLMLPLVTKEVRQKIKIMPHDHEKTLKIFKVIMGVQDKKDDKDDNVKYIPYWLGGDKKYDIYQFNSDLYYPKERICEDRLDQDFLESMPYHAI